MKHMAPFLVKNKTLFRHSEGQYVRGVAWPSCMALMAATRNAKISKQRAQSKGPSVRPSVRGVIRRVFRAWRGARSFENAAAADAAADRPTDEGIRIA